MVVHEQSWSSIVCLLWWSSRSIVSSFFLKVNFSKIIFSCPFPFLCYSFCLLLSSILLASFSLVSMVFLWDFDKISVEILCNFYGASMIFYGVSKGVSMVVLCDSYGVSKGCLWDFLWIPMVFLWYFYGISLGCRWYFFWISTIFLWDYYV